jgi:hypothetical protein
LIKLAKNETRHPIAGVSAFGLTKRAPERTFPDLNGRVFPGKPLKLLLKEHPLSRVFEFGKTYVQNFGGF